MFELILANLDTIIYIGTLIGVPTGAFFIALAWVYAIGRMFSLVEAATLKNLIAMIIMTAINTTYWLVVAPKPEYDTMALIVIIQSWNIMLYESLSIILYVNIGFKLYDRMDDFFDRHVGKDKPVRKPAPKRKPSTRKGHTKA